MSPESGRRESKPAFRAWEARVLPLNYARVGSGATPAWLAMLSDGDARRPRVARLTTIRPVEPHSRFIGAGRRA